MTFSSFAYIYTVKGGVTMLIDSRLVLLFSNGVDEDGKDIQKTKSFNNIKPTATDEQLTAVVNALTPLQEWTLMKADRTNLHSLV